MKASAPLRASKFQQVRADLEVLVNRLGPKEKLPGIRELSVTMGTSIDTLSGALRDLEERDIIYRKHGVGIFVSPKRVKSVWVLCDSQFFSQGHSPFWDVLVDHARAHADEHNEHLSFHFTLPQGHPDALLHHALVQEIQSGRVQGVIGIGLGRVTAEWLVEQEVPFTAFAGWAPCAVVLDAEEVIRLGVRMLAGQGCQRIGFWMPRDPAVPEPGTNLPTRCSLTDVFRQSLAREGLPVDEALIKNNWHRLNATTKETFPQQGYRVAREVFQGDGPRPDGVVITDDTMTHAALLALARMGIELGTDLKIASHSNRNASIFLDQKDAIGRLEFDPLEVVQRLFEILESLMLKQPLQSPTSPFKGTRAIMISPTAVAPPGVGSALEIQQGQNVL